MRLDFKQLPYWERLSWLLLDGQFTCKTPSFTVIGDLTVNLGRILRSFYLVSAIGIRFLALALQIQIAEIRHRNQN